MITQWKIATCNTRGMNNSAKQEDIIKWHIQKQHTITCISETRLNETTAKWLKNKNKEVNILHTTNSDDTNGSGAGIIINRTLLPHIHQIKEQPGRCLTIILKFKNKVSIAISSIYGKANRDKKITREITKHLQQHHQHSTHSIIAGDFNEQRLKPKGLLKWMNAHQLTNLAKLYKKESQPTWTNGHSETTIDYIWLSHHLASQTTSLNIQNTNPHFDTNHQSITTTLHITQIQPQPNTRTRRKKRKIFNLRDIPEETWKK